MKQKLTQVHILPEEIGALIHDLLREFSCKIVVDLVLPNETKNVEEENLDLWIEDRRTWEILLSLNTDRIIPDVDEYGRRINTLFWRIVRVRENKLSQTALTTNITDATFEEFANKAFARLKKVTTAGVYTLHPDTGAVGFTRLFRYSSGAALFEENGGILLPVAGGNICKIRNPAAAE